MKNVSQHGIRAAAAISPCVENISVEIPIPILFIKGMHVLTFFTTRPLERILISFRYAGLNKNPIFVIEWFSLMD